MPSPSTASRAPAGTVSDGSKGATGPTGLPAIAARVRAYWPRTASGGSGSVGHLATELLKSRTGTFAVHVPYRGSALSLPDLVAGRTQLMLDIIVSALPLVEAGRLRALADANDKRTAALQAAEADEGVDRDQQREHAAERPQARRRTRLCSSPARRAPAA